MLLPNIPESQSFISWLYVNSEIFSIEYEDKINIRLRCRERDEGYIIKKCKSLNVKVIKNKEIKI